MSSNHKLLMSDYQILINVLLGHILLFIDSNVDVFFCSFQRLVCPVFELKVICIGFRHSVLVHKALSYLTKFLKRFFGEWKLTFRHVTLLFEYDRVPNFVKICNSDTKLIKNCKSISTSITFWILFIDVSCSMEGLVNITNIMN